MFKFLKSLEGQPVAVMCARYWYRGILSHVEKDAIVLTNPRAVESTGPSSGNAPQHEDPIPSDLIISLNAVEIVCQPAWVWHEMTTE